VTTVGQKATFKFAVDSALLSELGEKLVSTVHVALTELIKNAYDADATNVDVSIIPELVGAPRIVVVDNGIGMAVDDVRRFWMKIGTANKIDAPVSKRFGRLKTGSKGIGRFACRRLGANLDLTTCAKIKDNKTGRQSYQTTRINFRWDKFEPGIDVEDVKSSGTIEISSKGKTGTRLEIWGGVQDEWQVRGFNYLQRRAN